MTRFAAVVRGLAMLVLLASCATEQAAVPAPAGSAPQSSAPQSSVPQSSAPQSSISAITTSGTPTVLVPSPTTRQVAPPVTGRQLTLTGRVTEGVEHGCLLLTDVATGLRYNLTGGDPAIIKVGVRVRVVGVIRKDLLSYCQQGAIFQVLTGTAD